jgi:hypothetical protein
MEIGGPWKSRVGYRTILELTGIVRNAIHTPGDPVVPVVAVGVGQYWIRLLVARELELSKVAFTDPSAVTLPVEMMLENAVIALA